jgi:hypothetical protein
MSRQAKRLSRRERANCSCGHRAIFFSAGSPDLVRARRDHPLCCRCWRAAQGSERARQMRAAYARHASFVAGLFALV